MDYILLDIEWNGARSKKTQQYFNEIIEIGAVRLDSGLNDAGEFHAVIRPVVSGKLTDLVKGLTGIDDGDLADGRTFPGAVARLRRWMGTGDCVIMTWSTTDLLVLLENCRYFLKEETIPFLKRYLDLQMYFHRQMGVGMGQQIGLATACGMLGIEEDALSHHRALDDSKLSAGVLRAVFDEKGISEESKLAGKEFYERLTFKTTFISDINSPHMNCGDFAFDCEACGRALSAEKDWSYRGRAFRNDLACPGCGQHYTVRVQAKLKYDGPVVTRRIAVRQEEEAKEDGNGEEYPQRGAAGD